MVAAIYSRKSVFTGKGESIENQIALCKDYAEKYLSVEEFIIYEDEGYSGGNTNRPKFQQLIKAVKSNKINVLICYRLDRISRNVADFSSTLQLLQDNNVDFVSIKEQFDTTTPMGRAMVYISSVFAQLERETIAERVKDNMLQLAKTGRWLGGQEPYGYSAERITYLDEELKEKSLMKLSPIDEELKMVMLIYNKYLELHSITQIVKYLNFAKIKGKNGGIFASMQIKRLLSNPLYVKSCKKIEIYLRNLGINVFGEPNGNGYLTYNKTKNIIKDRDVNEWIAAVGSHTGVIEADRWLEVQKILRSHKNNKSPRLGTSDTKALLAGIAKCSKCNSNMIIKQGHPSRTKPKLRYDYYVCGAKNNSFGKKCDNKNIRIDLLDNLVINELRIINKALLAEELEKAIRNEESNNASQNRLDTIKAKILKEEAAISNLVKQLSLNKNGQAAKYIFSEIEKLTDEVAELKAELTLSKSYEIHVSNKILATFTCFNEEYDIIDNVKIKRILLNTVVDKVLWDGDNSIIKIFFKTGG